MEAVENGDISEERIDAAVGQGVADVLFGNKPFTGKLSYTWPREVKGDPLFEFGLGLE